ncbi:hypothetical protein ACFSJU_14810 [Paradesertivirga mongoliensis]|uniref:Uncharacterized protein n=1 Tax=Paradesertivirga mongoliensis TaxID=2100740 RepID=A0ABW4ZNH3_9SPHI|nr:hypothetical protein [Pedobacter mongoliensis]
MIPQLAGLLKPKDIKGETAFDIILKYWLDHKINELPEDLARMLERWKQVNAMIREGHLVKRGKNEITLPYKYNEIAEFLVEYYKISFRTAYNDIASAKRFFLPDQSKDEKEFGRGVYIEWGEQMMFEARAAGDYKSAHAFFKELNEIKGHKKDDIDAPAYHQVQLPHLAIVADPSELNDAFTKVENPDQLVADILARRKKTKLDKMISEADIAEEVPDGN